MTPESKLKKRCREYVEQRFEGELVHVSAKGRDGYPDSDLLLPKCSIVKVEFKKNKQTELRPAQKRWARWFKTNNVPYWAIGDYDDFVECCENHYVYGRATPAARRGRSLANG